MKKMLRYICSSDILPVVGGAGGGLAAAEALPSVQSIIVYIGMATIGAVVGYVVKLVLDRIFKRKKK